MRSNAAITAEIGQCAHDSVAHNHECSSCDLFRVAGCPEGERLKELLRELKREDSERARVAHEKYLRHQQRGGTGC